MKYEIVELELVNKLKANNDIANLCDVIVLPEDIDHYRTPTIKSLITVVFISEKFESNQSIGQVSQHTIVTFSISIQARKLRGERGIYQISEFIKQTLLGFSPSDCGPLILENHDFAGYQNDVWEHTLTFTCTSLRTQENASFNIAEYPVTDDEVFYHKK